MMIADPSGLMAAANGNFSPVRFSTRDLPKQDRVAIWREIIGRKVVRLDLEPLSDRPFHSEVYVQALPGLAMMRGVISDHQVARTPELIADGNSDFRLEIRCSGRESMTQRGREVVLGNGDAALISCSETVSALQSPGKFLGIHVPFADLSAMVPNVQDAILRPIPRDTRALGLLVKYLSVVQDNDELATPELRRAVVCHIHDLIALSIGASRMRRCSPRVAAPAPRGCAPSNSTSSTPSIGAI
jgi:hypothetical protein